MGFGTLFVGYFLLLNIFQSGFTDLIAASVMLLGLYKLSKVNKYFYASAIASLAFLVFGLGEFGIEAYNFIFVGNKIDSALLTSILRIAHSILVGTLTVLILKGIRDVAKEVDLKVIPQKADRLAITAVVIYTAWIVLQVPLSFIDGRVLQVIYVMTIFATLLLIAVNLSVIYSCYMRICMPGDEELKDKPSRFAFVNEYRARKAEKEREENERRIALLKERAAKKKGTKK